MAQFEKKSVNYVRAAGWVLFLARASLGRVLEVFNRQFSIPSPKSLDKNFAGEIF